MVKSKLLAAGVVLLIVTGATVLPAASASAAVEASVPAGAPDFTPSNSSARAWMLNILGRVLGKSTPGKWKREQLANDYRYNFGWETLNAEFGYDPASTGPYSGTPDSYDDYMIKKQERDLKGNWYNKPLKVPATAAGKLAGAAGAAVAVIGGYSIGTSFGNGILDFFGYNTDDEVCSSMGGVGVGRDFLSLLSGKNCDMWDMNNAYIPNGDIVEGTIVSNLCGTLTAVPVNGATGLGNPTCGGGYINSLQLAAAAPRPTRGLTYTDIPTVTPVAGGYYDITTHVAPYTLASGWGASNAPTVQAFCISATGQRLGGASAFGTYTASGGSVVRRTTSACTTGIVIYFGTFNLPPQGIGTETTAVMKFGMVYRTGQAMKPLGIINPDPSRKLTCTIQGSNGATYTKDSAAYTEDGMKLAEPECPTLPAGVTPSNVTVSSGSDEAGVDDSVLYSEDVTDEYLEWWTLYPECRTGACKLDLITLENTSHPVSCFDLGTECADWFADPDRASLYECHYGVHTVDLEECFVYSGVFKAARLASGAPYSDPMTGEWSGGENAPGLDEQALGQTIQNPDFGRSCDGMAVEGFDPVAFVMRPIQCALEWAFVPRPATLEVAGEELQLAFDTKAPGQLVALIGGWDFNMNFGGCRKEVMYSAGMDTAPQPVVLWDACPGSDMAQLAGWSRLITGLGFAVLVALAIKRSVSGTVDYRG